MNGSFIGVQELTNELFYFCKNEIDANNQLTFLKIGFNAAISCNFDLSQIANADTNITNYDEPIFYDPYLYFPSENTYYPIPIQINNIDNLDGYKTVRRFFISDSLSSNQQILVYLKSASFTITIYDENKIRPPLIKITYGARKLNNINSDDKYSKISFTGHYSANLSTFETAMIVLFVICLIFIVIIWIFKVYKYQKMNTSIAAQNHHQLDLVWFARVILIGFGVSSHLFFWYLFFLSSYCYLSYKGQSDILFSYCLIL